MKKQVFIVAGANGSGKTTIATEFLKELYLDFLNADKIAESINPDNMDSVKLKAGKVFLGTLKDLIKQKKSFALESTLSGRYLIDIIAHLKRERYKINIIYAFVDSPEFAIDRIKVRVKSGGHFVPDEDVIRRFYRSKNNFWNIYKNAVDEWQMFYNGESQILQVAVGERENYTIINEELFKLFMKDVKDEKGNL